ncbi:sulfur carrier protein ThiS [Williamsia sp.]|uniref:sulfur carrier protein ThiS n=1 Tax=Williamsia sp. TaxID=1872085 RepID=UPI002F94F751
MTTDVVVNGVATALPEGMTVEGLLDHLDLPRTGVAVAIDGRVRPKSTWRSGLGSCGSVEILTAVQGG